LTEIAQAHPEAERFEIAYSPELNPIERLWLHLRDNRLSHCVFQTTGEIVDTCCEAWNWLLGQTGRIRSLCSYPWLERVSD
jgi:transposase